MTVFGQRLAAQVMAAGIDTSKPNGFTSACTRAFEVFCELAASSEAHFSVALQDVLPLVLDGTVPVRATYCIVLSLTEAHCRSSSAASL